MQIPAERLRDLVFEALRRDFGSQWIGLTQAVAWVAIDRGIYPAPHDTRIIQIDPEDEPPLRSLLDDLLAEGVLALGIDGGNKTWPWISLTPAGREIVLGQQDRPPAGRSTR